MINSRQLNLIEILIRAEGYLTVSQLSQQIAVSERTLQKDLNHLQLMMQDTKLPISLDRKKGTGILFRGLSYDKEKFQQILLKNQANSMINQELQDLLIFHMLQVPDEKISLTDLANQLFVNRKVIQDEIKVLRSYFEQYHLQLLSKPGVGIQVIGKEQDKRRLLVKTLANIKQSGSKSPSLKEFFKQDRLKVIQDCLKEVLTDNQVDMVSDLSNIEIHIYFMLERMKLERDILLSQSEIEAVEDSKAQELSSQVLAKLTTIYPINFSPGEINYLAIRIASTIPSVRSAFTFDAEATQLMDYLVGQVDEMFNYQLKEDDLLKKNLLSHLSSTYFRLNYGLSITNPLTEDVFRAFPQLFLVIQLTLDDYFKQRKQFVPQEEIAYLAIHFQSAIERQKYRKHRNYQVVLVSEYSKAMATFIEARLQRELPELQVKELVQYKEFSPQRDFTGIDFILSTVPFSHPEVAVLPISPMISDKDLRAIEKYMLENSPSQQKKIFDIARFTQPFLIYPQLKLTNPEDILTFLGNNLVANGYTEAQFVDELLSRDRVSSTRVAPFITLPHANPNYVKKSIISIASLPQSIDWHGEAISLVIMIAVTKDQLKDKEFKKLFSLIHYIAKDSRLLERLCQTKNVLELLSLLSSYE